MQPVRPVRGLYQSPKIDGDDCVNRIHTVTSGPWAVTIGVARILSGGALFCQKS